MTEARYPSEAPGERGLAPYHAAASSAAPRHLERNVVTPSRTVGMGQLTTLKASFWRALVHEGPQAGDPTFLSISLHTGGGRAWRNNETTPTETGAIAMLPFEGADWRFEPPISFVQFHVPFQLLAQVGESLFDREIDHADLRMPTNVRDDRLCRATHAIRDCLAAAEPTSLLLDSWALILSETMLRRLSSHSERQARLSAGRLPGRSIARVVDYIETGIDQELRLKALSDVAGMNLYHFARSFKETVGLSPHAYVLSRRLARARAMLRHSAEDLSQVALACGFANQAHFTAAFRQRLGTTPGEYRRRAGT